MTATMQRSSGILFSGLDRWILPGAHLDPSSLLNEWRIAKAGDLMQQVTNRVETGRDTQYKMLGVKWYGEGVFHRETVRGDAMSASRVTPAVPGAFIYNRLFAWKASFAVVSPEYGDGFVSGEFPQFVVDDKQALPEYLYLYFTSPTTLKAVNNDSVGSAAVSRNRFKEVAFLGYQIPLPPLKTQRAILAKWHQAQKAIAAAEAKAQKIEIEDEIGFFEDLGLKRPERAQVPRTFAVMCSDFIRWSVSYNQSVQTGMDITKGTFPVVDLGSILTLVQYGTSEKANTRGVGVPIVRINNIKERALKLDDLKHIDLPSRAREGLLLKNGDILIIRTSGSRDLVGTCAVFHESIDCVFASYLIRMRTDSDRADPDFVSWFINSYLGRQQIDMVSRQIMQNNINSEELRSLQLPLPPLTVQCRIIKKVASGRARAVREHEKAKALRESIGVDLEAYLLGTKKVKA